MKNRQHPTHYCPNLIGTHADLIGCSTSPAAALSQASVDERPVALLPEIRERAMSDPSPTTLLGDQPVPPLCPECGQPMELVRTITRLGAPSEIFSFYCAPCTTIEVSGHRSDER
jgi:hypothetical protein